LKLIVSDNNDFLCLTTLNPALSRVGYVRECLYVSKILSGDVGV